MKLEIIIKELTPLKRNLLDSDMKHTQLILMDEMVETLDRLKSNRGVQANIVNLLKKVPGLTGLSLESFRLKLERMDSKGIELLKYQIKEDGKDTILILIVDDTYFDLMGLESVPLIGKKLNLLADGRKGFIRKVEKSIKSSYSKKFTILEMQVKLNARR